MPVPRILTMLRLNHIVAGYLIVSGLCAPILTRAQVPSSDGPERAIAADLVQRFKTSAVIAVKPPDECSLVLAGDRLCAQGRLAAGGASLALSRAEALAHHLKVRVRTTSADLRDWRDTTLALRQPADCLQPMQVFTTFTPVSTVEREQAREWLVRIFVSSYPKDSRCDGAGMVLEYTVSGTGGDGALAIREVKVIGHYSGMTPR
jgi:hypothetical protein